MHTASKYIHQSAYFRQKFYWGCSKKESWVGDAMRAARPV
jgi:hypothetical protein